MRDLAREPMPGEIRLQWWREVLSGERDGEAQAHPVAAALRETLDRYGLVAAPLLALIDERTFDLYDAPMASLADFELYAIRTQSPIFAMAAGVLGSGSSGSAAPPELFTLDASVACTIEAILSGLGRHVARGQLYLPADVLDRHKVARADIYAARVGAPLLAALAEMRALARQHLAAAAEKLKAIPAEMLPAFLPLALVGPQLARMERGDYRPFQFAPLAPWRRQWLLWRAARDPQRIFQK